MFECYVAIFVLKFNCVCQLDGGPSVSRSKKMDYVIASGNKKGGIWERKKTDIPVLLPWESFLYLVYINVAFLCLYTVLFCYQHYVRKGSYLKTDPVHIKGSFILFFFSFFYFHICFIKELVLLQLLVTRQNDVVKCCLKRNKNSKNVVSTKARGLGVSETEKFCCLKKKLITND